jgi:hypothetical protein
MDIREFTQETATADELRRLIEWYASVGEATYGGAQ